MKKKIKFLILIVLCLVTQFNLSFSQKDSLLNEWGYYKAIEKNNIDLKDTIILNKVNEKFEDLIYNDPERAKLFARLSYDLAQKLKTKKGIANGLINISHSYLVENKLDSGVYFAEKSIEYCLTNSLEKDLMKSYRLRGNAAFYESDYSKALDYYFKSAEISEKKYPENIAENYGSIGLAFRVIGNNDKSLEYLKQSHEYSILYKDTSNLIFVLNNLGIVYKNIGDTTNAIKSYEEGYKLSVISKNLRREGELAFNYSNLLFNLNQNELAFYYLEKSTEVTNLIGNNRDKAIDYFNLGFRYKEQNNWKKAIYYGELALELAELTNFKEVLQETYSLLSDAYYKTGKIELAYLNMKKAYLLKEEMDIQGLNSNAYELEKKFETEKKVYEDSLKAEKLNLEKIHQQKLNEEKLNSKNRLIWAFVFIILAVFLALFMLYKYSINMKEKNKIITEINDKISKQKHVIEEKHKEITDSINYAERIQRSFLATKELLDENLKDYFVFFQPKDVVSGDFYFASTLKNGDFSICCADSTGHGVPGAIMSILNISSLEKAIETETSPDKILNKTREIIIERLKNDGSLEGGKDGMDCSLVVINPEKTKITFATAHNPVWIVRSSIQPVDGSDLKELIEFKGDKMPVGKHDRDKDSFKLQSFDVEKGDVIYTLTDGFADQFGGEKGKKYMIKKLKELFLKISNQQMEDQKQKLYQEFVSWKGDNEQVDDLCIIGVRV